MPNKESFLWDFCKYFDKKGVGTDGRLLKPISKVLPMENSLPPVCVHVFSFHLKCPPLKTNSGSDDFAETLICIMTFVKHFLFQ